MFKITRRRVFEVPMYDGPHENRVIKEGDTILLIEKHVEENGDSWWEALKPHEEYGTNAFILKNGYSNNTTGFLGNVDGVSIYAHGVRKVIHRAILRGKHYGEIGIRVSEIIDNN